MESESSFLMKERKFSPVRASLEYPNTRAKTSLKKMILPDRSVSKYHSSISSMMVRYLSSDCRMVSSIFLRSVISRERPRNPMGWPSWFLIRDTETWLNPFVPSFLINSPSKPLICSPVLKTLKERSRTIFSLLFHRYTAYSSSRSILPGYSQDRGTRHR